MSNVDPSSPTDVELAAYVAGHSSPARSREIARWIEIDPEHRARIRTIAALLGENGEAIDGSWNRDRMWDSVAASIGNSATPKSLDTSPGESRSPSRAGIAVELPSAQSTSIARRRMVAAVRIAAAVIVMATAALYYLGVSPLGRWLAPFGARVHEYTTHRGERATIQLADGSRVILAPQSTLRVLTGFGGRRRDVELRGEAEFTVVHDSTREFSVRAGNARVVDIGTRFDVRAYPNDGMTRVAVAEGIVALGALADADASEKSNLRAEGLLVRRGETGRLDAGGHAETASIANEATYFGWTSGRLTFERAPVRDVLETIARWYDVDVRAADESVANRLVTAEFSTRSPDEMIRALAQAVDVSVVASGRTRTLVAR